MMKRVCSPCGIVDRNHPGQGIIDIKGAGFEALSCDLSILCGPNDLENLGQKNLDRKRKNIVGNDPARMHECLWPMLAKSKEAGLTFPIAVTPYLAPGTKRKDLNTLLQALAEESLKICREIGCGHLVISPLFAGITKEGLWELNREYYLHLAEVAKESGVMILLENLCRDINGHPVRGVCSDGRIAAEWVDRLNEEVGEERFGFCMDVGTCNLCGQNMYDFILALGSRIKAVVLRDNNGNQDNALLPFTAVNQGRLQTNWLKLIRGLREICFNGFLILNMADSAAAVSPILRPALLQYAKSVMDYFKWQIEIEGFVKKYPSRVLFGAGNMCRNYMACYGEQYPPLYTCDNNEKLWGTEVCGLAVKPPEALRELSPETAIFICNIYYREIEEQLRGMGLQNPIEFFNDEYLPALYLAD